MGAARPYSSLTGFVGNPVINLTIMLLIISGGLGFLTWEDIAHWKWRVRRYRLQSKIVLSVTLLLIVLPAIYFYFGEYGQMKGGPRILASLFQSVTTRTAGFNTTDISSLSDTGKAIMILAHADRRCAGFNGRRHEGDDIRRSHDDGGRCYGEKERDRVLRKTG